MSSLLKAYCMACTCITTSVCLAQASTSTIEEIIIRGEYRQHDSSVISRDAESLLDTAGDVNDPLKAILSLPGITFGGGDLDAPVIRGAGPQNNLFLVDGMRLDYLFHELSDSIISPNVVRTFDLHTAAFSPEFGDATGGVINIGLRDPSPSKVTRQVDLSLLKAGFLLEAPLSDKVSGYATYRHNLAHLFLQEFETTDDLLVFEMPRSRDYSARLIMRLNDSDITLTALGARDDAREVATDAALFDAFGESRKRQFDGQSLRLRTHWAPQTYLEGTLSYSDVKDERTEVTGEGETIRRTSWDLRLKLTHQQGPHRIALGSNIRNTNGRLQFRGAVRLCDKFERQCGTRRSEMLAGNELALRVWEFFLSDTLQLNDTVQLDLGFHASHNALLDQTFLEPRMGLSAQLTPQQQVFARLGRHHVAPDLDRLLVLDALAQEQGFESSTQSVLGHRWFGSDNLRVQSEIWYKDFDQVELIGTPLETVSSGETYGLDVLLAFPSGEALSGWIAASLSEGSFEVPFTPNAIDNPNSPALSATLALDYAFAEGWRAGFKYRVQSGDRFTPLNSASFDPENGQLNVQFDQPFSHRLRHYQRLDFRLEKAWYVKDVDVLVYLDALNILNYANIANRDFPLRNLRQNQQDPSQVSIVPDDEEGIPRFVALGVNLRF